MVMEPAVTRTGKYQALKVILWSGMRAPRRATMARLIGRGGGCWLRGQGWLRAAALRRPGYAEEGGGGLAGLGGGGEAEFGEPGFQQAQGAADRVGAAGGGLDPHDALVEVFVVGVVAERGVQRGESLVGFGGFEEFGDGGPGVQRAAAGGDTGSIPPPTSTPTWVWRRASQPDQPALQPTAITSAWWCPVRSSWSWPCAPMPALRLTGRFSGGWNWPLTLAVSSGLRR